MAYKRCAKCGWTAAIYYQANRCPKKNCGGQLENVNEPRP